jgi:hypothetical protein
MAVTPFNADLASALVYAQPQVGTLTASTVPTSAQATLIWQQAWGKIVLALKAGGIGATFTADSAAEQWVWMVEGKLTSGLVLLEKGSRGQRPLGVTGTGGDSTADRLLKCVKDELMKLEDKKFRLAIIASGGTASNLPASGFTSSDFLDWRDTSIDITPGGDNVLYIPSVPTIQDGEGL